VLGRWFEEIQDRHRELAQWVDARADFWAHAHHFNRRIPVPTQYFIDTWIDLALGLDGIGALVDSRAGRNLIRNRERKLKGNLARLFNTRALEMWNGAAGTGRLSFRWAQVQTILWDILRGLGKAPR